MLQLGSYVIANDLLGIIVEAADCTYGICDKDNVVHHVNKQCVHELVNGYALSLLRKEKLVKRVKDAKG